jgi:hypothetical protein
MKVFMDLEFTERGRRIPIQLVSIALIREDGETIYRINPECLSDVAIHPWVSVHVAPFLPMRSPSPGILIWDETHDEYQYVARSFDELVAEVLEFVRATPDIEIWAWMGHYDHVVFHQLFGSMNEQPAGVPLYTRDIQELILANPQADLPAQSWRRDHAMDDARWAMEAYQQLTGDGALMITAEEIPTVTTDDAYIIEI